MRRRDFCLGLSAVSAAIPVAVFAQRAGKKTIGFLGLGSLKDVRDSRNTEAVRRGLAESGYVEGRDFDAEYRAAEYRADALPGLAADLVSRKVDLIVALASPALTAAQAATKSIPIVFLTGFDPVANRFVEGLNRPGTNLTGISILTVPLSSKRMEFLHELLPAARSIAVLSSSSSLEFPEVKSGLNAAAETLGLRMLIQVTDTPGEFAAAFDAIVRAGCEAVAVGGDAVFTNNRRAVVEFATRHRIPAVYADREYVVAGGLASYGPDFGEAYRVLGTYAGRILHGEKPDELPVQQITSVQLVLNAKTAKALNIAFPPASLARADEVIE